MLPRLSAEVARKACGQEKDVAAIRSAPVRVLQIGTGNFLRAFCGWMFERMNACGAFHGTIAVAQATPNSSTTQKLREQDGCYTVLQRGLEDGRLVEQTEIVTCVTRTLNPYEDWGAFLQISASPELRYVVSNTTEAGIVYRHTATLPSKCPDSFPAQMAVLLHHRFTQCGVSGTGLIVLPCELTENNGTLLHEIVLRHAAEWRLGDAFSRWVIDNCTFCNTLVHRVVTGYPHDEAERIQTQLGYQDSLLVTCELAYSWIIEGPEQLAGELPFTQAGLNVRWTWDVTPFRTMKVRILNGAHTAMMPVAFLAGADTVLQAMSDPLLARFVELILAEEILPELKINRVASPQPAGLEWSDDAATWQRETLAFAEDTLNRFQNPTIQHRLLSIALNSTSKWKVRVLPSLMTYVESRRALPRRLTFSLAALIALYRVQINDQGAALGHREGEPYELKDTPESLRLFADAWRNYDESGNLPGLVRTLLGQKSLWDTDLNEVPSLSEQVTADLDKIVRDGMRSVHGEL